MANNRENLATMIGINEPNTRRSVNGMPVSAMGPENVVVIGANAEYPLQVVPYSGIILNGDFYFV